MCISRACGHDTVENGTPCRRREEGSLNETALCTTIMDKNELDLIRMVLQCRLTFLLPRVETLLPDKRNSSTHTPPPPVAIPRMPDYDVRGIKVQFPHEAYPCQLDYLERVVSSLQEVATLSQASRTDSFRPRSTTAISTTTIFQLYCIYTATTAYADYHQRSTRMPFWSHRLVRERLCVC